MTPHRGAGTFFVVGSKIYFTKYQLDGNIRKDLKKNEVFDTKFRIEVMLSPLPEGGSKRSFAWWQAHGDAVTGQTVADRHRTCRPPRAFQVF